MLLLAAPVGSQAPDDAPSFVNEGIINAPVAAVWNVWTSGDGYRSLGVAKAEVDFRIGGLIRSHYSPTGVLGDEGTIQNRILAYEPRRMIAIRIDRPPKSFPFKEAWKNTWTVITLTDLGNNRTHLRVASMGFGADEESIAMWKFFEAGNAYTLKTLQKHFDSGSVVREEGTK
ncbi:MAG: SRPBCC domain-containing protein [Bryobacteraceae bacterium]|jgi:uncharacterized protein YndB with AHSA1/START domain